MSTPNPLKTRAVWRRVLIAGLLLVGGLFLGFRLLAPIPARLIPPVSPEDPVKVWVLGSPVTPLFYHNSLILPDDSGQWWEYSFGDREVFANNQGRFINLAQAVLYPTPAVLGRQTFNAEQWQRRQQRNAERGQQLTIEVERTRVQALLEQLNQRHKSADAPPQYNRYVDLYFVPDTESYTGWNTCNHLVARWLRQLDCQIRGLVFSGHFRVD